jgi:hypothetical protein
MSSISAVWPGTFLFQAVCRRNATVGIVHGEVREFLPPERNARERDLLGAEAIEEGFPRGGFP